MIRDANDVVQATGEDVNMFADDTSVCAYDKSVAGLQAKLQLAVDTLAAWFGSWVLTVNRQKCAFMVFTTARAVPLINITLDSEPVSQVLSHKHLGLLLDSHISWSPDISPLLQKHPRSLVYSVACDALSLPWLFRACIQCAFGLLWNMRLLLGVACDPVTVNVLSGSNVGLHG